MKTVTILFLTLFISVVAYSQGLYSFSYTISFPTGETSDYIGKPSFRGVTFDARGFITDNISLGGLANWTVLYEHQPMASVSEGSRTVSGTSYSYINAYPILFTAHYYWTLGEKNLRIYGGTGIGVYSINKRTEAGIWYWEEKNWHFGFAPEAGILIPVGFSSFINMSLKWNYALKTDDTVNHSWFGFNIGYAFSQY